MLTSLLTLLPFGLALSGRESLRENGMIADFIRRCGKSGALMVALAALATAPGVPAVSAADGDAPVAGSQTQPENRSTPVPPRMRDPGSGDAFADPPPADESDGTSCPTYDDGPLDLIV